jgi:hypothetical protein
METRLASTEERLASASRLCDVEKAALEQVLSVRITRLERRLYNAQHEPATSGCACELARCQQTQQHHLATAMLVSHTALALLTYFCPSHY